MTPGFIQLGCLLALAVRGREVETEVLWITSVCHVTAVLCDNSIFNSVLEEGVQQAMH